MRTATYTALSTTQTCTGISKLVAAAKARHPGHNTLSICGAYMLSGTGTMIANEMFVHDLI
jgi:hypothetical protein